MSAARATCEGIRATRLLGVDETVYVRMRVHQAFALRNLNSSIYIARMVSLRDTMDKDSSLVYAQTNFPSKLRPFFQGVSVKGKNVTHIYPSLARGECVPTLHVLVHKSAGTRLLAIEPGSGSEATSGSE